MKSLLGYRATPPLLYHFIRSPALSCLEGFEDREEMGGDMSGMWSVTLFKWCRVFHTALTKTISDRMQGKLHGTLFCHITHLPPLATTTAASTLQIHTHTHLNTNTEAVYSNYNNNTGIRRLSGCIHTSHLNSRNLCLSVLVICSFTTNLYYDSGVTSSLRE